MRYAAALIISISIIAAMFHLSTVMPVVEYVWDIHNIEGPFYGRFFLKLAQLWTFFWPLLGPLVITVCFATAFVTDVMNRRHSKGTQPK